MEADRRRRLAAAVIVGAALVATGCSSEPASPAEQRRDRLEARLAESFSRQQVDCILDELDDDALVPVDATGDVASDDPALAAWSDALAACVADVEPEADSTGSGG